MQSRSSQPPPLTSVPGIEQQAELWDSWNTEVGGALPYMERLRDVAVHWVATFEHRPRILEVGCGTGWMTEALATLGRVVSVDLSPAAIEIAKARCPSVQFVCGDFLTLDLPKSDVVLSVDTIAHVADQSLFMDRLTRHLVPGGRLVLMSQNAYSYGRSSWVKPPPPGLIRRWPSLRELRQSVRSHGCKIEHVTTVAPLGATDGIYRFFNSRRVWAIACALIGHSRTIALYERLQLGRDWLVVARRK